MTEKPQPTKAVEVFYSYAHVPLDEELKNELLKHLSNLERQGIIISWHDRKITAGREWAGEIDEHINTAGLILLLVSPDFMASGYCNDVELKRAMERHEAGDALVIPVILRPVDWKGAPFERLQALPTDARPITRRRNRDTALLEVAQGIRTAVAEIAARPARKLTHKTPEPIIPRPPVVGFIARRDEQGRDILERLKEELAPEKNQLVALWGPGGTGKTTLAAELVRATEGVFDGRVAWASSLRRSDFNLSTLLDEIATQLGREDLRRLAPEPKAAEVAALVGAQPTLVVLDNFETIAAEEQIRCLDFLAQSAACPALITTRSFINRDDVSNVPLAAMTMEEARDFLRRLVERTRKPSNFDKLNRDDLIRRCEANPLVLHWVVRQIDLAKRPQDVLHDLARGEGDAAERVFTRSFNLPQVGDDGRDTLLALSLFTPHASHEALAEVAGFGGDLHRLGMAVEGLSALWLVEATDGNERLFLRGLTRELAKSRLSKDSHADAFRRRYVAYCLRHAQAHTGQTLEDLDALEVEKDNLLNAMDVAFELKNWHNIISITDVLLRPEGREGVLSIRGHFDDAIRLGHKAVEAARQIEDNEAEVVGLTSDTATILLRRGEFAKAKEVYEGVLPTARRIGDDGTLRACLHNLGVAAQNLGELEEARRLHEESLALARKVDDETHISNSLHQLGRIAEEQNNFDEARKLYNESLALNRKSSNHNSVSMSLYQLGNIAYNQNDLAGARRLYRESLEIDRRFGNKRSIAIDLHALANVARAEGNRAEARRFYEQSLGIMRELGNQVNSAHILYQFASLAHEEGEWDEAAKLYRESLRLYQALGPYYENAAAAVRQDLTNVENRAPETGP